MHFDQPIPGLPTPFRMLHIPGGTFRMGSPPSKPNTLDYERPDHNVTLPDFWLGELPVTQDLWQAVMGGNPSGAKGPRRPVERVSWDDAQMFIKALNRVTNSNKLYRLPTEAEWEYAARGGNHSLFAGDEKYWADFQYAGSDFLLQVGWGDKNSNKRTHEVGLLLPNELGLYDLSGNVFEWCQDNWHDDYTGAPANGSAWEGGGDGSVRVLRGGSWRGNPEGCRSARRGWLNSDVRDPAIGLRLAR